MLIRSMGRLCAALLLLFVGVPSLQGATLAEKVQEHTCANGLKLLVVERPGAPVFSAYLTVGVGAVHETSSGRGVAHLLEHLRFKGTTTIGTRDYQQELPLLEAIEETGDAIDRARRQPDEADAQRVAALEQKLTELQQRHRQLVVKDEFSQIYARNGGVGYNAFTSKDLTSYLVSLPANKLELWASLEADRMRNSVLREFYTEREVIKEERRRSYDSNADGLLYETLLATAFSVHPYRHPIIGWPSDIANLSPEITRSFMERYYSPVNTVIALVGAVEFDQAVALVERYFGSIPPGTPVPEVAAVEPAQRGEKRVTVEFDAEPRLAMAFHKPTLPQRDDYVFDVLDQILSQGRTSRLYRALVVEQQLATEVASYGAPGYRYPNLFVISAVPRHPHTADEVESALVAQLQRLATEPVSELELERVRNRLRVDHLRYLQSNGGLARMLTFHQTVSGDWRYLIDYEQQIASVTAEDLMRVAATYLVPGNRTVATLQTKEP
ncbi:MAG: pitrilysin family protein [Syntrophotaleaceae bacterium]